MSNEPGGNPPGSWPKRNGAATRLAENPGSCWNGSSSSNEAAHRPGWRTKSAADISGLLFNVAEVESVEIDYFIKRIFDSGGTTTVETGKILGSFDGSDFIISTESTGGTGVVISALASGQFQYTSTNLANHTSSLIRFRARTIDTP